MNRTRTQLAWTVGRHASATAAPDAWVPATVPGAVQLDWARAHGLPDYTIGDAVRHEWAGLDESWWTYRATIESVPSTPPGGRVFLVLEGVDYAADVAIDDAAVGAIEGLQTALELDVTDRLRPGTTIEVRVHPAPKSRPAPADRTQADRSCKPAVAYSWDFHPRLVPLGLWRPAYLESRPATHFAARPAVDYRLGDDAAKVEGRVTAILNRCGAPGAVLRWTLLGPDGGSVCSAECSAAGRERIEVPFELVQPALWWPHDQGTPALHTSELELLEADGTVADRQSARVGFRRIRLIMAPEQWRQPSAFPKSRSDPPITLEVNGRALFVKGSNWVCPDIFPGTVTRERHAEQLALVRSANLSLLRAWGGATAPSDDFFELCDELGIMVWQEFPLSCNRYPDDPDYLAVLDRESRSLTARLRGHAALVLWCGGNELFNAWSGMTDQSLPLRLLNRNCYELDPGRPFLATAPLGGMGHGHYVFRDPLTGDEVWALFQQARCTAYTEFGCPAPAAAETLRRIIPAAELWPPRPGTAWETHHAFGAWLPTSHLYPDQIEYYFGPAASLEELVERGQLLQGVGLQGLFEEARRQKPAASMALSWCFNEPWPTAASNAVVGWPCRPRPALDFVRAACRPTLASARLPKFSWRPGELFSTELWLLHDAPAAAAAVAVHAWLELDGRRLSLGSWAAGPLAPNGNARGPRLEIVLPDFAGPRFALELQCAARPEWNSRYVLAKTRPDRREGLAGAPAMPGATNF